MRTSIKHLAVAAALAAGVGSGIGAAAATPSTIIEVFPGANAISNALAGAVAGDTLNIHAGTYSEHFSVTKASITLKSAGDGLVTVDGKCQASWTIQALANRIQIAGLTVIGGSFGEINFSGVSGGKVSGSTVNDTCGAAEYGINVFNSSTLKVLGNTASGFGDAGIYIGALTGGNTTIRANDSFGNNRGIIVENTSSAGVLVVGNNTHDNDTTGIWVTNTSGISVRGNTVTNNSFTGIQADPLAGGNLITHNTVSGHQYDLSNDGTQTNCWMDNQYTTSRGDISC
jgi:parallel beta-helix repeat protein